MKDVFWMPALLLLIAALLAGCAGQTAPVSSSVTTAVPSISETPATNATVSPPALSGTSWKLGWYDDTKGVWSSVIQGSTITATFTENGTIIGSNGCTGYTTEYVPLKNSGIWMRRPVVPETTCQVPTGVNSQQSAYYTDLIMAAAYTIEDGQLLMFDKTGKKILQFDAMP